MKMLSAIIEWLFPSHIQQQVQEDTCSKHAIFLCKECFDLSTWGSNDDHSVKA